MGFLNETAEWPSIPHRKNAYMVDLQVAEKRAKKGRKVSGHDFSRANKAP